MSQRCPLGLGKPESSIAPISWGTTSLSACSHLGPGRWFLPVRFCALFSGTGWGGMSAGPSMPRYLQPGLPVPPAPGVLVAEFCSGTKWVFVNILSGAAPVLKWWTRRSRSLSLPSSSPPSLTSIPISATPWAQTAYFAASALSFFAGLHEVSALMTPP